MNKRFEAFAMEHNMPVFTANLQNNFSGNLGKNMFSRLRQKARLRKSVNDMGSFIEEHGLAQVFFSNAEGFVSYNSIPLLKKKYRNTQMVALQHGVFPLRSSRVKEVARITFNSLSKFFFGLFLLGPGFGGIKLDKYYVYSDREKEFLVKHRGWGENMVKVAPNFIKIELIKKFKSIKISQSDHNALFLGQCLSLAGFCTQEMEKYYSEVIINHLAGRYKKLFIKGHPTCISSFDDMDLPDNVFKIDDMLEGFAKCKNAYSFFSSSLLDAKIFNLRTTGIIIEELKLDDEIYENFDLILKFEDIISS